MAWLTEKIFKGHGFCSSCYCVFLALNRSLKLKLQINNNLLGFFKDRSSRLQVFHEKVVSQKSQEKHRSSMCNSTNPLTANVPLSYRNRSIDLQCKSIDWFRYDGKHWSLTGLKKILIHVNFMKSFKIFYLDKT